jgi:predicted transcriptional regulator
MTEYSPTSAVCVLYTVVQEEPITAKTVAKRLDEEPKYMSEVLLQLTRAGVLDRSKRTEQAGQPFEYRVSDNE